MSNFKVVIVRPDRTSLIKDGLTRKEADELAQQWRDETFNSDNYFDPVPKVVVLLDKNEE